MEEKPSNRQRQKWQLQKGRIKIKRVRVICTGNFTVSHGNTNVTQCKGEMDSTAPCTSQKAFGLLRSSLPHLCQKRATPKLSHCWPALINDHFLIRLRFSSANGSHLIQDGISSLQSLPGLRSAPSSNFCHSCAEDC